MEEEVARRPPDQVMSVKRVNTHKGCGVPSDAQKALLSAVVGRAVVVSEECALLYVVLRSMLFFLVLI